MNPHKHAARIIISGIIDEIRKKHGRYIITIAGETGSGKTETGKEIVNELESQGLGAILLGQDNYFFLPPKANDASRKSDPEWLGPHKEVNLSLLEKNLIDSIRGVDSIVVPHIDYYSNNESRQSVSLINIKVLVVEGTYTSLLKHVDTKIFIDADYKDTLKYRKMRNRGNEVDDPFTEGILETEHKIIAGHKFLADFIITKSYEVITAEK
jgi:uridine kinase